MMKNIINAAFENPDKKQCFFTGNSNPHVAKALGPLHYHSCTWSDLYPDNIALLEGVKTANWSFGTSTDPAKILERFSGKYMLIPYLGLGIHKENGITSLNKNINSEIDLVKYILDHMQGNTSLYFSFDEDLCNEANKMVEIYKLFDSYGYTPTDL